MTLFIDALVLFCCAALLVRHGRLSFSHPATIYLFFHAYTVTTRLLAVFIGAPALFSTWGSRYEEVTHEEIARAALMADAALIVMTAAWIRASQVHHRTRTSTASEGSQLRVSYIWGVVALAFPIGVAGLVLFASYPSVGSQEAAPLVASPHSSWLTITQAWPGLCLLALIYWYGFRPWLLAPMLLYLVIMAFQGGDRFRVVLPSLLLAQIYLDRQGRRWPSAGLGLLLFCLGLMFFPLKSIGQKVQQGTTFQEIVDRSTEIITDALSGKADDHQFLDQFASAVSLLDENGQLYLGQVYLPLLTLPIPRQWWSEKPGLGDYIYNFSTHSRPMGQCGMCVTYLGEAYANFGYLGILIVPYLLAYWLAKMYFAAYRCGYFTVQRLACLLIMCNLLQVFRDGLLSIVVFTWVNMLPLMIIIMIHRLVPAHPTKLAVTRSISA